MVNLTLDVSKICAGEDIKDGTPGWLILKRLDGLNERFRAYPKIVPKTQGGSNRGPAQVIGLLEKEREVTNGQLYFEEIFTNVETGVATSYELYINTKPFNFSIGDFGVNEHISTDHISTAGEVAPNIPDGGGTTPSVPAGVNYSSFYFASTETAPTTIPNDAVTWQANTHSYDQHLTTTIDNGEYVLIYVDSRTLPVTDLRNDFGSRILTDWTTGETVTVNNVEYTIYRLPAANQGGNGLTFRVDIRKS